MASDDPGVVLDGPATWSKRDVIRGILRRECMGLPLNQGTVIQEDHRLQRAALRLFGQWDTALQATGIDPTRVRRARKWDWMAVVRRIQQLARQGKPLNSAAVQRSEAPLVAAAFRYFPSWNDALLAAGMDPDRWRKQPAAWTRDRVVRTILGIQARGGKLNSAAVVASKDATVIGPAVRLYGSWDKALRAAGMDPNKVRRYRKPWTEKAAVRAIQRKHRRGEPLAYSKVAPASLRVAGERFFGSWDAALSGAGLNPADVRLYKPRCKPWTVASALEEIRRKHRAGEPLNTQHVSPYSLRMSGVRFFGSWDEALIAAGLDPSKIRKRPPMRNHWRERARRESDHDR